MTQQALKVTASTVTKLYIEGAERLDPISVYLEDLAPKKGKITVSHNGYSWTAFWPGMWEGRKIADWFAELNVQYVIGYFAPQMQPSQFSSEKVAATVKREILKMRRAKDLDWHRAREAFEECEGMELCESEEHLAGQYGDLLNEIVGDDWWYELQEAKEPNPYYTQLTRIILAVQQALKQADTDICWSCSSPMPAGCDGIFAGQEGCRTSKQGGES